MNSKVGNSPKARQVLIVDDDGTCLALEKALFESAGANVTSIRDPIQGVAILKERVAAQNPFDLIVLDIHMPGLSGIKAAAEIRQAGYGGPIVAFTAVPTMKWKKEGTEAGIDAYFNKQTLKKDLVTAILDQFCKS